MSTNKKYDNDLMMITKSITNVNIVSIVTIGMLVILLSILLIANIIIGISNIIIDNTEETFRQMIAEATYSETVEEVKPVAEKVVTTAIKDVEPSLESQLGNDIININGTKLINYDLPNEYYGDIDFSSFQPYMSYRKITDITAPAYAVVNDEDAYTDDLGLRRMETTDNQFTINGEDDYIVAMGTFYKDKGIVGNRYLIVTTTGMYTATTGDEKADEHTDKMNMFTRHGDSVAIIEWIVDTKNLDPTIKSRGTVTANGPEAVQGEILYVYGIQ